MKDDLNSLYLHTGNGKLCCLERSCMIASFPADRNLYKQLQDFETLVKLAEAQLLKIAESLASGSRIVVRRAVRAHERLEAYDLIVS